MSDTECRHLIVFSYDTLPPRHVCEGCGAEVPLSEYEKRLYARYL